MENPPPGGTVTDGIAHGEQALQLQRAVPDETACCVGVDHTQPCTASNDPKAPVCHLFHQLPSCNHTLRCIGLQLQEVDAPGELSLVQVSHDGFGPHQERCHRSHARVLFYGLLVSHRCVTRVDITGAVFEGGAVDEIFQVPVRALQENSSLRILNVMSLPDCEIMRGASGSTHAEIVRLQEVHMSFLVEALRTLIIYTTALKTLDVKNLSLDDREWKQLLAALMRNRTLTTLSVPTNILLACSSSGAACFSRYLKTATWLASLTVLTISGDGAEASYEDLRRIVKPLLVTRTLAQLTLLEFRLDARCAGLLGRLVARNDMLEFLDIATCYWIPPISCFTDMQGPPLHHDSDAEKERRAECRHVRSFIRAFKVSRSLKFLALDLGEFSNNDIRALFIALSRVESLKKVIVVGIFSERLRAFGLCVREADMSGLVSLPQQYEICPEVITALGDCPGLHGVVINTRTGLSEGIYKAFIRLLPTWSHVTTLWLLLSEKTLDEAAVRSIARYLSETTALKELRLLGYDQPDLSLCTGGADMSRSLLLEALFLNKSVSVLQVRRFFFGEENLRFLAESVRNSITLCEFHFLPLDGNGHTSFIRFLLPGFASNHTLLRLRDPSCTTKTPEYATTEEQFIVEDVLVRNRGLITRAAEFVVNNVRTDHCAAAMQCVSDSPGLVDRVMDLTCVDEPEAVAMIQRSLQELRGVRGSADGC